MSDAILGAIVGAVMGALGTAIGAYFLQRTSSRSKARARQTKALQQVIDMSHDVGFIDNPSVRDYPDYCYTRVGELRDTILKSQGVLPIDNEARPTLATMQSAAGELRQGYRSLERPLGHPDSVKVRRVDFEPYVEAFLMRFDPELASLEKRVHDTAAAGKPPWARARDRLLRRPNQQRQ